MNGNVYISYNTHIVINWGFLGNLIIMDTTSNLMNGETMDVLVLNWMPFGLKLEQSYDSWFI